LSDEYTSTDVTRPGAVLEYFLEDASRLIDQSIRGETQEDFRTEFVTYWQRICVDNDSVPWRSLLRPRGPSRLIRVWRGRDFYLVGDDDHAIKRWLEHLFGKLPTRFSTGAAVLIWLSKPLIPQDYPHAAEDVRALARNAGAESSKLLDDLADDVPDRLTVVLGALANAGPCFAGVTIIKPTAGTFRGRRLPDPLDQGHRKGHVSPLLLRERYFAKAKLAASSIARVDASWIHGRDRDERQELLVAKRVVVLGCGSVGAPIALHIAAAGVGTFALVDPDALTGPNTSRHELGAMSVGQNKAERLRELLLQKYPHMSLVTHYPTTWQEALAENENLLAEADLVVVAIGNWHAEAEFNDWHLRHGCTPVVLYAWVEPRAGAGHAVAIGPDGGCFQCGFDVTGVVSLPITVWPDEMKREREPGCGAVFQPYGGIELAHITALASELAINVLLDPSRTSIHRMWAADRSFIERSKGALNPAWVGASERRREGGCREEAAWTRQEACPACGSRSVM
jgi:molybdopterin/thiamine biosynthesis adenylyltransferase